MIKYRCNSSILSLAKHNLCYFWEWCLIGFLLLFILSHFSGEKEAHYFLINGPASRKGRRPRLFPHAKRSDKWWYYGWRAMAACRAMRAVGFGCSALGFTLWLFEPAVWSCTGQGSNRCTMGRRDETEDRPVPYGYSLYHCPPAVNGEKTALAKIFLINIKKS